MLKRGIEPKTEVDKKIARQCFIVSKSNRYRLVKCNAEAVEQMKSECEGYFMICSNDLKDFREALYVYKLRDGIERRFDDLKMTRIELGLRFTRPKEGG